MSIASSLLYRVPLSRVLVYVASLALVAMSGLAVARPLRQFHRDA
jgi:hypothetical protein